MKRPLNSKGSFETVQWQQKQIVKVVKQMRVLKAKRVLIQDRIDNLKVYQAKIQIRYEAGESFF